MSNQNVSEKNILKCVSSLSEERQKLISEIIEVMSLADNPGPFSTLKAQEIFNGFQAQALREAQQLFNKLKETYSKGNYAAARPAGSFTLPDTKPSLDTMHVAEDEAGEPSELVDSILPEPGIEEDIDEEDRRSGIPSPVPSIGR